ncbi:uncharacterized protein MONOS_13707 [Monocercomonoides exilis]|uniref:uncharacterized protein n=1 Tax=Monocercomonoides exilis TaxID=2049356 RepID=UPI00355A8369|nr:hypothetical protein MONOS_13707 [Monocercomonoides exilis]|eukprot:MONOS_13707.1-p1 / transcript=MONOS_13707.1 / gene=MONOS_13707 / organism=Monocercomonoides_exilis_PA203 / gene_product=unspecified product / transcript_product=unspecified product / location=Mono_scaffold00868:13820-15961(+) / protein_length=714 / sequence_SO=supercontig / SO=protein_coding / is_pseudo=false
MDSFCESENFLKCSNDEVYPRKFSERASCLMSSDNKNTSLYQNAMRSQFDADDCFRKLQVHNTSFFSDEPDELTKSFATPSQKVKNEFLGHIKENALNIYDKAENRFRSTITLTKEDFLEECRKLLLKNDISPPDEATPSRQSQTSKLNTIPTIQESISPLSSDSEKLSSSSVSSTDVTRRILDASSRIQVEELLRRWKPLPSQKRSMCYAVDRVEDGVKVSGVVEAVRERMIEQWHNRDIKRKQMTEADEQQRRKLRQRNAKKEVREAKEFYKLFGEWVRKDWEDEDEDEEEKRLWREAELKVKQKEEEKEEKDGNDSVRGMTLEELRRCLDDAQKMDDREEIELMNEIMKKEKLEEKRMLEKELTPLDRYFLMQRKQYTKKKEKLLSKSSQLDSSCGDGKIDSEKEEEEEINTLQFQLFEEDNKDSHSIELQSYSGSHPDSYTLEEDHFNNKAITSIQDGTLSESKGTFTALHSFAAHSSPLSVSSRKKRIDLPLLHTPFVSTLEQQQQLSEYKTGIIKHFANNKHLGNCNANLPSLDVNSIKALNSHSTSLHESKYLSEPFFTFQNFSAELSNDENENNFNISNNSSSILVTPFQFPFSNKIQSQTASLSRLRKEKLTDFRNVNKKRMKFMSQPTELRRKMLWVFDETVYVAKHNRHGKKQRKPMEVLKAQQERESSQTNVNFDRTLEDVSYSCVIDNSSFMQSIVYLFY